MRPASLLAILSLLGSGGCSGRSGPVPVRPVRDTLARRSPPPPAVRDTALEQRADRLELRLIEKEAQVDQLQARLDDARREVVRAMAKLQSLATRAEAASGMAEAEIALQALRAGGGSVGRGGSGGSGGSGAQGTPEISQAAQLLQLATAEFDKQNYGGALYLANQAKEVVAPGQERVASVAHGSLRQGEVPFALPLKLQAAGRANVRTGPGSTFPVSFTVDAGTPLTGYSYVEQWVRVADESGRSGWIYQGLIGRRP